MEYIELVVKIDEDLYEMCKDCLGADNNVEGVIANGTLLPKGHGKLGDLDKIADRLEALRDGWNYYGNEYESGMYNGYDYSLDEVMSAEPLVEADKAESEG